LNARFAHKGSNTQMSDDLYTEGVLRARLANYKQGVVELNQIVEETGLPIRNANPPEDITENIVKFTIRRKMFDASCVWAKSVDKTGDLWSDIEKVQEVKAFTSDGPCSFGPTKKFDVIYFLDMRQWLEDKLVLWRVGLSNESATWRGLRMNATETHEDQAGQGRRPHIGFNKIYDQRC
jgi:hypothetical protein